MYYFYAHLWCLVVQASINWEGWGRRGIQRKNGGDDGGGGTDSPYGAASSQIVDVPASVIFLLHHKTEKMAQTCEEYKSMVRDKVEKAELKYLDVSKHRQQMKNTVMETVQDIYGMS